jgi:hypothetical protein
MEISLTLRGLRGRPKTAKSRAKGLLCLSIPLKPRWNVATFPRAPWQWISGAGGSRVRSLSAGSILASGRNVNAWWNGKAIPSRAIRLYIARYSEAGDSVAATVPQFVMTLSTFRALALRPGAVRP